MKKGWTRIALVTNCILITVILLFHAKLSTIVSEENIEEFVNEDATTLQILDELINYSLPSCHCFRKGRSIKTIPKSEHSLCSDYSTQRGMNMKVYSYSTYNIRNNYTEDDIDYQKYLSHTLDRAAEIKEHFPGWVMRLYHNISTEDHVGSKTICQLFCLHDHVDICDVKNLPVLGNLYARQPIGRLWRFTVMGDPTVGIFNSRDTDSAVLSREVEAVKEWLNSNYTFHVMRDHPYHYIVMLAGLWGAKTAKVHDKLAEYMDKLFSSPANYNKGFDQAWLSKTLWPFVKKDVMQHDSFTCTMPTHKNSIPWPTKREAFYYVGWGTFKIKEMATVGRNKCPLKCRPEKHKDWDMC